MTPNVQQEGNNGQMVGLPAQAAALERAVRSLQSRWMQIQDVVAGMQQMLQYIEESQSMMSAARAEQQQLQQAAGEAANGEAAPEGASDTAVVQEGTAEETPVEAAVDPAET